MSKETGKLISTVQGLVWHHNFLFSDSFVGFLNLLPEAAIISDTSGRVLISNKIAQDILGYSKEEFLKLKIEDLVPPEIRKVHPKLRNLFFEHPTSRFIESREFKLAACRRDGTIFPMESSLFAIHTDKGVFAVNLLRDITEQKEHQEKMESYAFVDPITSLPNRRYFDIEIKHNMLHLSSKNQIGLLYIDLDNFKEINDKYGHNIGDKVLSVAAERLLQSVRGKDVVARIGGDEFLIMVYPASAANYLEKIAQRIIDACTTDISIDKINLNLSMSIGITIANPDDKDVKTLISRADKAMYKAKNSGGNKYYFE